MSGQQVTVDEFQAAFLQAEFEKRNVKIESLQLQVNQANQELNDAVERVRKAIDAPMGLMYDAPTQAFIEREEQPSLATPTPVDVPAPVIVEAEPEGAEA